MCVCVCLNNNFICFSLWFQNLYLKLYLYTNTFDIRFANINILLKLFRDLCHWVNTRSCDNNVLVCLAFAFENVVAIIQQIATIMLLQHSCKD